MALILDSDAPHNRLRHRAAMAELVDVLGMQARAKIVRTATSPNV